MLRREHAGAPKPKRLGMAPATANLVPAPAANSGYSTREVADTLGLAQQRIRRYRQRLLLASKCEESGEYRFSFQDMVLLRTAKGLLEADVAPRRALAALAKLTGSNEKPLSAMRVSADGGTVVVRDGEALWDAETGQGHLSFAARPPGQVHALSPSSTGRQRATNTPLAGGVHEAKPGEREARGQSASAAVEELDSDDWYNLGLDLEDSEPAQAPAAYQRSIALNPGNADAHVNLGRLYQGSGDVKRATRHYQLALNAAPNHQLASYNLGTVFDELGEIDAALAYYQKAPDIPDAHYNLARIFELRGDEVSTRRHMRNYKRLLDE